MIIRRMTANFGKLKNQSLELQPGLNIIQAPNEAGKSTWCAFIRAMLYGINTREQDTAGKLADKNRYQPWDGSAMSGTMELESRGQAVSISRAPLRNAPFKDFSARYTGTGEQVQWLAAANAGEALTGVSEGVFARTAFIRQAGIKVDGDPALEKRIAAIVSGGDENQSYAQTDAQLRAWQRERRHNRSGQIPRLEATIHTADEKLKEIEGLSKTIGDTQQELQRLEQRRQAYTEDLEKYAILDKQAAQQRVLDAKRRAKNDLENYESAQRDLMREGGPVTREDLDGLRADLASVSERHKMVTEARAAKNRAKAEEAAAAARLDSSPFAGRSQQEVGGIVSDAQRLAKAAENPPVAKRPVWLVILSVAMLVLGVGGAAALLLAKAAIGMHIVYIGLPVCGLLLAAGLLLLLRKPGPSRVEGERLKEFLALYGFDSAEDLEREADTYYAACQRQQSLRAAMDMSAANEENAQAALEEAQQNAAIRANRLMPQVRSTEDMRRGLQELDMALSRLSKLELNMNASRNTYETLRDEQGGDPDEDSVQFISPPMRSREDTEAALSRCISQLDAVREKLLETRGQQRAMGDPMLLASERERLEDELAEKQQQYDALALSVTALREADAELQTRFSPLISAAAGKLLSELTGGKYDDIVFSKDFGATVKAAADSVGHNILALSAGAGDQAYLALRLALVELALVGDETCPVILDDALASFDDERAAMALDLIQRLAQTRQVIMFTCHTREAEHFADAEGVNVVGL